MGQRWILHADMDAFYASVEQRDNPALRGKPVAVGGAPPRGVVSAASYEARVFGVHSAMPMVRALQLCPDLVVPPLRMETYVEVSAQVFEIFRSVSPLVEPLSLDEAFIDVTGTERLLGPAPQVARQIRQRVRHELDLVVSIGVAPNKFVAKVASDVAKPDGLLVVEPDQLEAFLHPLPVSRVFGVGAKAQAALAAMGIQTIGQLAQYPQEVLLARFGELGDQLWHLSRGLDDRPVEPERAPKSIGHETTFTSDLNDLQELSQVVLELADQVAHRLRRHGFGAKSVVLKAKTHDFRLITRRRSLARPTSDGELLGRTANELLARLFRQQPRLKLRLVGVTTAALELAAAPRQLTFDEPEHQQRERLGETLDSISRRFGADKLMRASTLDRRTRPKKG